jgi:preprotein translocase subunit YajC
MKKFLIAIIIGLFPAVLAAQNAQQSGGSIWGLLLPFIVFFLIFYFLIIVPEKKHKKEHAKMIQSLKKGDRVKTSGGIIGTITRVDERTISLKTGQSVIKVDKYSVVQLLTPETKEGGASKNE